MNMARYIDGFGFRLQTQWLHCTMQNMFTLHRLGLGSLLFIGQEFESDSIPKSVFGNVRAHLHQLSVSTLQPLCDDTSDSVLIEINEDV